MDKIIEMTLDGRLTLVWLFFGWFAAVAIIEAFKRLTRN